MLYFQDVGPRRGGVRGRPAPLSCARCCYSAGGEGMANPGPALADAPRGGHPLPRHPHAGARRTAGAGSPSTTSTSTPRGSTQSGLFGPVSFYRNLDANWERVEGHPGHASTPCRPGFLTGVARPGQHHDARRGRGHGRGAARLPRRTVVEGAGHWVQQERPAETNAALLAFLAVGVSGRSIDAAPPPAGRRALADRGVARGRAARRRRPGAAARRGVRRRRPAGRHLRRRRRPGRPAGGRALPRRARALRPRRRPR